MFVYFKGYCDSTQEESQIKNNSIEIDNGEDMKNVRKRTDGRYEYRKMINGQRVSIIKNTLKELKIEIKKFNPTKLIEYKQPTKLIDLIWQWYNTYKKGQIKSEKNYEYILNKHFKNKLFEKDISKISLQELQVFLNNIDGHRVAKYCYFILKGTYFSAYKNDLIKKDISIFLDKPKNKTEKGINFTLEEQKLILENLDKSKIKYEILFYLLTGSRRSEPLNIKKSDINFEKCTIHIKGTKTKSADRYVPMSQEFANILKNNFESMFQQDRDYYSKEFQSYLKMLNIKNKKLHDLRHTYSTNLYYLGVPDKERQYYMGHSSIVITNDIYTTLDPSISKNDILKLYNNLYPKF